jgi:hypothetical protein
MSRVLAFFMEEAVDCLATLRSAAQPPGDPAQLYGAARRLRGNAQLARIGPVAVLAGRLEETLRDVVRAEQTWTDVLAASVAAHVAALERSVHAVGEGRIQQDMRAAMSMDPNVPASADEVPIEELEYAGNRALERSLELRTALEDGIVSGDPVGPILDELFDLIRLGIR